MSKATTRRRKRQPTGSYPVVYIAAGILLAIVAWLFINLLRGDSATGAQQWSQPPAMEIDPARRYTATVQTAKGDFVIELFADVAPQTVNNFIFLARQGYYDGVTFHRVLPGFMAQGGDPTGTGSGGPGYRFPDEIDPTLQFDSPGVVAMANAGPDTNGSQFFITYAPATHLNGLHTIFGQVISGMEVVEALSPRDPDANPNAPPGDAIETITISEG